jgi:hypothetical protein
LADFRLTLIRDPLLWAHPSLDISESHSILPAVSQTSYTQEPSPILVLLLSLPVPAEHLSLPIHPTLTSEKSSTTLPKSTPSLSLRMTLPKSLLHPLKPTSNPNPSPARLAVQTVLEPDITRSKMENIPYVPHVSYPVDSHLQCSLAISFV